MNWRRSAPLAAAALWVPFAADHGARAQSGAGAAPPAGREAMAGRFAGYDDLGAVRGGSLIAGSGGEAQAYRDSDSGVTILVYRRAGGEVPVVANEIVVTAPGQGASARIRALAVRHGLEVAGEVPGSGVFLIRAPGPEILAPAEVAARLRAPAGEGYRVEPNSLAVIDSHQDRVDPVSERQWSLQNIGLRDPFGSGTADADSDGLEALSRMLHGLPAPARRPVVAVLDTGLALRHPAFANTRWTNSREIAGNNRDDDGNGFVDDFDGWDFVRGASDPLDYNGHGTHVAGIVGARQANREVGTWGVAPHARIMPLKVLVGRQTRGGTMFVPLFSSVSAIDYAWRMGADIINMSFESYVESTTRDEALARAHRAGALLVAAAGNGLPNGVGIDVTARPVYPCVTPYVLCVGATDRNDNLAGFSNFGIHPQRPFVEIAAPGVSILSTVSNTGYMADSGTSMAAPLVAGALAAVASVYPGESDSDHLRRVLGNADRVAGLKGKIGEGRRLNLYHALFSRKRPSLDAHNDYCSEVVFSQEGVRTRRWQNSPYANSGEAGIDGATYQTAFRICSAQQLQMTGRETRKKVFRLAQDIDWSALGEDMYPLGDEPRSAGEPLQPYLGALYGDHYSVVGLRIKGRRDGALIAHLAPQARVDKLNLRDVQIDLPGKAAALAVVSEGTIWSVSAEGRVKGAVAGGLVAEMKADQLRFSFFAGRVTGQSYAGGLVATASVPGRWAVIDDSRFEGQLQGTVAGGIVAEMRRSALVERNNAVVNIAGANIAGGVAGRVKCGAILRNVSAEGEIDSASVAGGVAGVVGDAKLLDSYSTIFMRSNGSTRGGTVGRKDDAVLVIINGQQKYDCTGTQTKPAASQIERTFFDSVRSANAGAAGIARTTAQLRLQSTFPAAWWKSPLGWQIHPDFSPAVKPALPRTTAAPWPYTGEVTPECEPHCPR